jgi:hypothetical protein
VKKLRKGNTNTQYTGHLVVEPVEVHMEKMNEKIHGICAILAARYNNYGLQSSRPNPYWACTPKSGRYRTVLAVLLRVIGF